MPQCHSDSIFLSYRDGVAHQAPPMAISAFRHRGRYLVTGMVHPHFIYLWCCPYIPYNIVRYRLVLLAFEGPALISGVVVLRCC
jgi:hypothetical protein